jgi:hypothetical protein
MVIKSVYVDSILLLSLVFSGGMIFTSSRAPVSLPGSDFQVSEQIVEIDVREPSSANSYLKLSMIDWGSLDVGDAVDKIVVIRNVGYYGVTLSLNTTNWDPVRAADYIQLSWDYDGSVLYPGSKLMATLTLTVDTNIPRARKRNDFSFDTIITGIQS